MKSVDILFNVRPELARCGHHFSVRDSETGCPVPDISDVGEVSRTNSIGGIYVLTIPIEQPWLLVSEIDLTDPVTHPKIFVVRLLAIDGEYHGSLEENKNGKPYWEVGRSHRKAYPFDYFKYYQPISGPEG